MFQLHLQVEHLRNTVLITMESLLSPRMVEVTYIFRKCVMRASTLNIYNYMCI